MSPGTPIRKERFVLDEQRSADFFQTMGIPLSRDRFNAHDTASAPQVALVNHTLARQFFLTRIPIGQTFDTDPEDAFGPVQIAELSRTPGMQIWRSETPPTFYLPYQQRSRLSHMMFEIRTAGEPERTEPVRTVGASVDREPAGSGSAPMTEQVKAPCR